VLGADVTHNEITAQMVSSLFFVPEADTIFEIGGQDSKYIFTRDGRLADFEMNKICSGGTGSFLEEQAERLGIRIVEEFSSWPACSSPMRFGHALHSFYGIRAGQSSRARGFIGKHLCRAGLRGRPQLS
jgi:activator of 2-hydroxyglutaryl-CoA dehydratase